MEENRRISVAATARKEEEEEDERRAAAAASTLVGPARRSLRRWARPAPYTPSPRRFISDFLSKPSPPIRSLIDTSRASLPPPRHDRASGSALGNELVAGDDGEVAEIERMLKARTFSRDEADRLLSVIRSRTTALNGVTTTLQSVLKAPTQSESRQSGLPVHQKITWKAGDSVYSKANALGCTPIDIAKAYMRDLSSSRIGNTSYQTKTSPVAENATERNKNGSSSSTNLRICWPGADLLPGNTNSSIYTTPQQSKGKNTGTPYADSHFSRSIFKVKNDRDSYDLFSTGKKRRLTTSDGAKNQKAKLQDDTPFRVIDHEASRENILTTFTHRGASPINSSLERKGKNMSLWSHNRKSTETAQKILSHLERAIPSSSEKPPLPLHRKINHEVPPSGSLLMNNNNNKKTESVQASGNGDRKTPDVNEDGGAAKSNAPPTKKNNSDTLTFGFTFPITPAANISYSEPPPTPTMPSSPQLLPLSNNVTNVTDAPDFSFGSSLSSRLVFSFYSSENENENASSAVLEEPPTYKFGSGEERISFAFPDEDGAICC